MTISFRCPFCGRKLRAADEAAGRRARCSCRYPVVVPGARTAPTTPADAGSTLQEKKKPRRREKPGELPGRDAATETETTPEAAPTEEKTISLTAVGGGLCAAVSVTYL